jgi:hypothetical protein
VTCPSEKIPYVQRRHAKDVVRRMKLRGDRNIGVYACEHCGLWHVGHRPPAVGQGTISIDQWQDDVRRRTA